MSTELAQAALPHLTIDNLALSIHGKEILRKVSLQLPRGKTLGLVGESGSGKSLTSLLTLGLLPNGGRIQRGKMIFNGKNGVAVDLTALQERDWLRVRGRKIAMIFQNPSTSLNPCFTIGAHFKEILSDEKNWRTRAVELMNQVSITDPDERLKVYPHQLSGGMSQRVMIALALARRPEILLADEPTTALDVTIQAQILALLKSLQRETGMSMIFVSHDLRVISEIADFVAVMQAGEVVETGEIETVLRSPQHEYTRSLMQALNWSPPQ